MDIWPSLPSLSLFPQASVFTLLTQWRLSAWASEGGEEKEERKAARRLYWLASAAGRRHFPRRIPVRLAGAWRWLAISLCPMPTAGRAAWCHWHFKGPIPRQTRMVSCWSSLSVRWLRSSSDRVYLSRSRKFCRLTGGPRAAQRDCPRGRSETTLARRKLLLCLVCGG